MDKDFPDFDWSSSGLGTETSSPESSLHETDYSTISDASEGSGSVYYDAVEEPKYKRSSSLRVVVNNESKSWGEKKIVRFADCLGLDLVDVKIFLDEIPLVPDCAFRDLTFQIPDPPRPRPLQLPLFVAKFKQPIEECDFGERLEGQKVLLESCRTTPTCLTGTIRVINQDYHKSVYLRFSWDGWGSFSEMQATYNPTRHTPSSDSFSFLLPINSYSKNLSFAIRYHNNGAIHWDNNGGRNYSFEGYSQF